MRLISRRDSCGRTHCGVRKRVGDRSGTVRQRRSSVPERSPRLLKTWIARWRFSMTPSAWRSRRCRPPVSGRTIRRIHSCSRCSISRAQKSVTNPRDHGHTRHPGTDGDSERAAPDDCSADAGSRKATLVLMVRDLDATLARARQAKATVETPGGKPVAFADGTRAILIRDIDRRFIELRQPPPRLRAGTARRATSSTCDS